MRKNHTLAEAIRRTAYFMWEHDGRPPGKSLSYWLRAKDFHRRSLAYDRWLAEGKPVDRNDANWLDAEREIDET